MLGPSGGDPPDQLPHVQYGFLIDHRRCIGCHACTVACKSENDVPVGDFRTWVQYAEHGRFPAIKRHFAVLRCNHCTNAPCITICPVNALEKRDDGIVDLDRDACIGCRGCMQACPYDAIYLNEDSGSAEKCHYCAHRTEQGLEPACVVVCPTQAIVPGDLHDKTSRIAQMVAELDTEVRRPEQNTGPNVHYVGHEPSMLRPGSAHRPETYIWSERPNDKPEPWPEELPTVPDARIVLDTGHKVEWGWHVAAYLVTKGIAAGCGILAPFAGLLGLSGFAADYVPELLALAFMLVTTWLLVIDLARPKLFLTLLTRPNTKSWLVKGAWILIAFSTTVPMALAARAFGFDGIADFMRLVNVPLALGVAGYTAFLFAQCEGRDLWQSKLLLPHLLVQAVLCGSAALLPFTGATGWLGPILVVALMLHGLFAAAERNSVHDTENARQGAAFLPVVKLGPIAKPWKLATRAGILLPTFLVLAASRLPATLDPATFVFTGAIALVALAGLYLYEAVFIRAGQLPPLS